MEDITTKEHKRMSSFLNPKSLSTFVSNASSYLSSNTKREKNSMKNDSRTDLNNDYDANNNNETNCPNDDLLSNKINKKLNQATIKLRIKTKKKDSIMKNSENSSNENGIYILFYSLKKRKIKNLRKQIKIFVVLTTEFWPIISLFFFLIHGKFHLNF